MIEYALGRRLNHDPRSRSFPAPASTYTRPVLWRTYGPVLDQGQVGACTGFAGAHALNTAGDRKSGDKVNSNKDGLAFYEGATTVDPFPGQYPPDDTGSDANSVAKWLRDQGRIASWSHCFGGAQSVIAALQFGPVLLGINWHRSMFTPSATGIVHPDGDIVGGHETCIRGWDGRYMLVRNSWGKAWGLRGHYRLSPEDLDALLSDQGDATFLHRV